MKMKIQHTLLIWSKAELLDQIQPPADDLSFSSCVSQLCSMYMCSQIKRVVLSKLKQTSLWLLGI